MANIKVTYGSISRRLTISSTTTWSEIETQFRNLFNIPKEFQIIVSYTDDEGDVITLSSDLELQEVLSNNSNNAIKFILTTSIMNNLNDDNNVLDDREKSTDTIIDDETSNLINGVSSIQIEDPNNDKTTSKYKHVTITDEIDDPLFNQQQETIGENSKNATESNNNDNVKEKNPSDVIHIILVTPLEEDPILVKIPMDVIVTLILVVMDAINTLHSMGFFNDNLEELVRKYNGNLEAIIEVLLFNQQNEQNNENVNKQVVREENNEKDQPMEIEEENNKPYVLK
ncbi:13316_t:CDS:2 [Rhizophagus irregularis]|nr:13316_t:CDS:2 [Rhizophagus irregularis]